jgi:SAM-dependent methyltransferase
MAQLPSKLNLGCGQKKLPDHLNVDRVASVKPDVVHDLNQFPYPFPDGTFEEICAYDVVEHIDDIPAFMAEVRRMARPGARIIITTPHFSCANSYIDPTHQRHLSLFSFDYFTTGHQWNFYGGDGFIIARRQIIFSPSLVNSLVHRLANRYPSVYEYRWAWIFPAWYLHFELTVRK